ncbi:hypothetical protein [Capnocytophaga sputigena]|uniref:hypothetical protein n=1 Tax=Capnocytophaga sputigena TaxID=1019 RepID=UPI000F6D67B4|nr:hypothetical protein [Capnocytophaga sputigena]VEI52658.1 Uncharacterised protein [Capnocytophaga sputigena]
MKTVFKVGMEVWDKTISPNKGKVIEVLNDTKFPFPIKVKFDDDLKIDYTGDGCFVKSEGAIPTLSTSDYSIDIIGFEQKAPAPTYEEALKEAHRKGDYYYLPDCLEVPSEELVDATIALLKLLFLRDYYNEGWQPNLKNKEQRGISVILDSEGNFFVWGVLKETETYALVFKDEKVAKRFIEEQKELLEIAKPLL